ncbi:hypothetical protein ACH5RR_025505 [Cinchona calisaya]|uniref:Uncharacterized protein n=1 Tax=Cinchona calisaya TaxID=153742 RepID=A0ABD2YZU3_9GENT
MDRHSGVGGLDGEMMVMVGWQEIIWLLLMGLKQLRWWLLVAIEGGASELAVQGNGVRNVGVVGVDDDWRRRNSGCSKQWSVFGVGEKNDALAVK